MLFHQNQDPDCGYKKIPCDIPLKDNETDHFPLNCTFLNGKIFNGLRISEFPIKFSRHFIAQKSLNLINYGIFISSTYLFADMAGRAPWSEIITYSKRDFHSYFSWNDNSHIHILTDICQWCRTDNSARCSCSILCLWGDGIFRNWIR